MHSMLFVTTTVQQQMEVFLTHLNEGQGLVEPDELVYPPLGQGLFVAQPH